MVGRRTGWLALLAVAGLALLVGILAAPRLLYPPLTPADLQGVTNAEKRVELRQAQAKLENDARATLLQAIAGGLLVVGAVATWRQVRISSEQLEVARQQALDIAEQGRHELQVTREGQIAELFTRAIDQLGSDKVDIQLGGIFAMERIARDSGPDRSTINAILAAFVRTHAPWSRRSPSDPTAHPVASDDAKPPWLRDRAPTVNAALTVLVRRPEPRDELDVHLPLTDLRGAYLVDADLPGAMIRYSNLAGSVLEGVNLERGELQEVDFHKARLSGAHLGQAHLRGATLEHAVLADADLRDADLSAASLRDADLRGTDLRGADLRGATLHHANLRGANLTGARLDDADLTDVAWDATTTWPEGFDPDGQGEPGTTPGP